MYKNVTNEISDTTSAIRKTYPVGLIHIEMLGMKINESIAFLGMIWVLSIQSVPRIGGLLMFPASMNYFPKIYKWKKTIKQRTASG